MDDEYLRKIRTWLRAESPGKVVDVPANADAETEIIPMIPLQRAPLD
jgi:hypothetical protein